MRICCPLFLCRTLYIPPDDRSGWDQLQAQTLYLISKTLGARRSSPHNVQVTIVAESFGGCLALRLAAAAPQLVKALVLVNPATSYNQSLSGLSSFVAATNLLGLFPQNLYNTAQVRVLRCTEADIVVQHTCRRACAAVSSVGLYGQSTC